jgi:hypothetical protein
MEQPEHRAPDWPGVISFDLLLNNTDKLTQFLLRGRQPARLRSRTGFRHAQVRWTP